MEIVLTAVGIVLGILLTVAPLAIWANVVGMRKEQRRHNEYANAQRKKMLELLAEIASMLEQGE